MTKLLFVSDIHLNLKRDKEFEEKRFKDLFKFIKKYKADYLILGGDIFDAPNPTIEELGLFYQEIAKIKNKEIILISGNHENLSKVHCTFDMIPQTNFKYFDNGSLKIEDVNCYFTSHHKIKEIKDIEIDKYQTNILFSHLRSKLGVIKSEIATNPISKKFDYIFLGDLHSGEYSPHHNVHYCGSPYSISFSQPYQTGVFEIVLDKDQVSYKFIPTNFQNKWKLFLNYKQYQDVYKTLNDGNLYKIVLECTADEFNIIERLPNMTLVHSPLVDDISSVEKNITDNTYNINVLDELKDVVKNSDNLSKDSELQSTIEYVFELLKNER